MRITVVGGGNGSSAAVVDQVRRGHEVTWYRRGGEFPRDGIEFEGILGRGTARPARTTSDVAEAVRGAELVLAPVPAHVQPALLDDLLDVLQPGAVVAFLPGTFGSWMAAGRRPDVVFLETGTLPYLTRLVGPWRVSIPVVASNLPVGSVPGEGPAADEAHARFALAYPCAVRLRDGIDAALTNWGPVIHPPLLVHNVGAIESLGDRFDLHDEGTSPGVRRTQIALDAERVALRERLGLPAPHWPLSWHYDRDERSMYPGDAHQRLVASDLWRESVDLDHRYFHEDVTLGLVANVDLADRVGAPAPVGAAILALLGAALDRDLRSAGRTLDVLGIGDVDLALRQARRGVTPPAAVR